MKNNMSSVEKGFTLIELLVVIAIIGILASVVLVSLNSARIKGRDSHVISDIQQLRVQIETDYTTNYNNSVLAAGSAITGVGGSNPNYITLLSDLHNFTPVGSTASTTSVDGGTPATTAEFVFVYPSGIGVTGGVINIGTPVTAYAIYGKQSTGRYFCLDSKGNSLLTDATPFTVTCQ